MQRRIFISGTDHGLGAALAVASADRGDLVFAGVLAEPAPEAQVETRANGGAIRRVRVDIGSDASVAQAVALVAEQTGAIDLLVNNAGILGDIERTAFEPLDFDRMAEVYNVNALGSLRLSRALLPLLLAGLEKLIVNISSEAGAIGACGRSAWYGYAMSKAALNMQSALLHNLLRDSGGRVLVLHPGHVRSFMRGGEDLSASLTAEEAARLVLANIESAGQLSGQHPAFLGPHGEHLPW